MRVLKSIPCQGCQASVPAFAGQVASCAYCGARTPLAQEEAAVAERIKDAEQLERQGLRSLELAIHHTSSGGIVVGVVMAAAIFLPGIFVAILHSVLAGIVLFVLSVPGVAFVNSERARRQAQRRLASVVAAVRDGTVESHCPSCGCRVSVPTGSCAFPCAHCDGWMIAAEGLIIQWLEDAQARKEALRVQGRQIVSLHRKTLSADSKKHHDIIMFGIIGVLVVAFGVLFFSVVNS